MLSLHDTDMADMTRSDRAAAEKVFGALLGDQGCLRRQRNLRDQLQMMMAERPPSSAGGYDHFVDPDVPCGSTALNGKMRPGCTFKCCIVTFGRPGDS